MIKPNKILTGNIISVIVLSLLLIFHFNLCGNTFDMCIILLQFYVLAFLVVLITSFIISFYYTSFKDKIKYGFLSVIFSPVAIWLTILVLDSSNLNLKDAIQMFYVYIAAILGSLINLFICFVRDKIK
jgi:hypothetical protein